LQSDHATEPYDQDGIVRRLAGIAFPTNPIDRLIDELGGVDQV
jgi:hypothetical protein